MRQALSRRSRSNPWWTNCNVIGHECRWCEERQKRDFRLDQEKMVIDLDPRTIEPLDSDFVYSPWNTNIAINSVWQPTYISWWFEATV